MRMLPFYHAFMVCIRSTESSDPSLLANIDPKLVKKNKKKTNFHYRLFHSLLADLIIHYH